MRTFLFTLLYILSGTNNHANAAAIDTTAWMSGRTLFKNNCASCHNPTMAQTGPALMGVTKRWDDAGPYQAKSGRQWLYSWIRHWNEPVEAGYPYAVRMQNYAPSQMDIFPNLSDDDISHILIYVENPQPIAMTSTSAGKEDDWGSSLMYAMSALVAFALIILLIVSRRKNKVDRSA